jgi:uncharacterized protein (TIGR02757 family)
VIENLKSFLDAKVEQYNRREFIENDPIVIPHQFTLRQDVEIMGFFAAILAWGQRKTIISKCKELSSRMDNSPFEFITNHQPSDLKVMLGFKHRTFNDTDLLYFIHFFQQHYLKYNSLEEAFIPKAFREEFTTDVFGNALDQTSSPCFAGELRNVASVADIETSLNYFRSYFTSLPDFPKRTVKHVTSPSQKSTCKRLNMFLRWMVRKDEKGVDFGIWNKIKPSQLICPCDVHVDRVARKLNLIQRKQTDWLTALELSNRLREFDPEDPVKYDFALFGLGVEERF